MEPSQFSGEESRPGSDTTLLSTLNQWFDSDAKATDGSSASNHIDWLRAVPFVAMHIACLGVFFTGISATALLVAGTLYALRMFAITAFYHRFFAHRTFRASRGVQFAFALLGASAAQRGPLWWAAHHRSHHRHADTHLDPHSPGLRGFLWSHMGWFLTPRAFRTDLSRIPDFARYPELRWLDRYDIFAPLALAVLLFLLGTLLARFAPELQTSGAQLLVWGFFVSTTLLFHATVTINSLAHRFGSRRFSTRDDSRNNAWLALLTFGEGWHNNHHFFPGSARQGFYWWELDLTWIGLRVLAWCGLVHDLKPVPAWVLAESRG